MTRIDPQSRKPPEPTPSKRAKKRAADAKRAELKADAETCIICRVRPAEHTHEIAAGRGRHNAIHMPRLQMPLCWKCHATIHTSTKEHWPPAKQIAARIRWEIERTCADYCDAMGLAYTAVTPEEVILRLVVKRKKRKAKR